jgi:hypothetical protein
MEKLCSKTEQAMKKFVPIERAQSKKYLRWMK